jgi:hypothetical protein
MVLSPNIKDSSQEPKGIEHREIQLAADSLQQAAVSTRH